MSKKLKIKVGSKNQVKIRSVQETLSLYPDMFKDFELEGIDAAVELFGHPKNLKQTIEGAMQRAKFSFTNCAYSIGLEGGLIEVPYSKTGYMEIAVCAIYDGNQYYLGLGPAFEWPKNVTEMILVNEADASQAFKKLGLTDQEKLGASEGGIVGYLTSGRLTREEQTKQSIITALIQLENSKLY